MPSFGPGITAAPAPGTQGSAPLAATAQAGRMANDASGTGAPTPGATPPVSPTVPNPTPGTTNATAGLPGAPTAPPSATSGNIPLTPEQQATYNASVAKLSPQAQGFANAKTKGGPAPQAGGATGNTKDLMPPENNQQETPPTVQNFLDPSTNKPMAEQVQTLMDLVSPQATRDNLAQEMGKITDEKNTLAQEKLQLMNVKNIMAGSEQDIRDEITKANGFATNSQVLALTVGRNATLLKDAQFLQDQLTAQQDLINNDTTLLASDKADAASQLQTRMGLMQYIQTNQNNQLNAYKDSIKTMISTPGGLAALSVDPQATQRAETANGWAPGTISSMAKEQKTTNAIDQAYKQAETAKIYNDIKNSNGLSTGLGLKDYVTTSSKGNPYVDLSTVTDKTEKKNVEAAARASGVPVLTDANVGKMNAIEDTRNNLENIQAQFDKIGYSNGATKAFAGAGFGLSNRVSEFFGNTDIGSFKAWRTAAINSVQALAGGAGSGLRINAAEIDAATKNDIPNIGDTLAVGKAKMDVLRSQLDSWEQTLLGSKDRSAQAPSSTPTLLPPAQIPSGYYQASDGLLYQK